MTSADQPLKGYTVEPGDGTPGAPAYRLHGADGTLLLFRYRRHPTLLYARTARGQIGKAGGFYRFTDAGGSLRGIE